MNTHEDSLQRQQTKDNSHEVGGADRVLDVKELTIWEAVANLRWVTVMFTWEAVALRS